MRRKSLFVSIILILGLGIIINNFANAQEECSCEKNNKGKIKIKCPGDVQPTCNEDIEFTYPKCRKDDTGNFEPRCCKKREDGTFKCHKKDESGNKIIFQVTYQAGLVDNSGNSNEDDVVLNLDDDDISDQPSATTAITTTPEATPGQDTLSVPSIIEAPNVGINAGATPSITASTSDAAINTTATLPAETRTASLDTTGTAISGIAGNTFFVTADNSANEQDLFRIEPINNNLPPAPPENFRVLGGSYFDISFQSIPPEQSTYTITVRNIQLPSSTDPEQVVLLHYENDTWTDITTRREFNGITLTITGTATSLSPFVVAIEVESQTTTPVATTTDTPTGKGSTGSTTSSSGGSEGEFTLSGPEGGKSAQNSATPPPPCNNDSDCAEVTNDSGIPTPVCLTSPSDPTTNFCVQCTENNSSACVTPTPVCLEGIYRCVECLADANCSGTPITPACNLHSASHSLKIDEGKNNSDTGTCLNTCKNATCGDGFVRTGVEQCDPPMEQAQCPLGKTCDPSCQCSPPPPPPPPSSACSTRKPNANIDFCPPASEGCPPGHVCKNRGESCECIPVS